MIPKTIRVQGKGNVSQAPDRIRINFTLSTSSPDFEKAVEDCNQKVVAVRGAASSTGLDPDELKTNDFKVRDDTEYRGGKNLHVGFVATHVVGIVLPIDRVVLGRFLSSVIRSKAKPDISLTFEVSNPEELKQRVLASAVENAKRRAETIASAAGIRLGAIAQIEYGYAEVQISSLSSNMETQCAMSMSDSAPEFNPDDVEAEDTVTITWAIAS